MGVPRDSSAGRCLLVPLESHADVCAYLPEQTAVFEHYLIVDIDEQSLALLLQRGYRYFSSYLFRPAKRCCGHCLPIRVSTEEFKPTKSQRRCRRNGLAAGIEVRTGEPSYRPEKFALYRKHKERFEAKGGDSEGNFQTSFYHHAWFIREFEYYLDGELIGVGYVTCAGNVTSSQYFYYGDRGEELSLGTWSMLYELAWAKERGIPYHYLGYFISANRSMEYKAGFRPCEVMAGEDGWVPLRDSTGAWVRPPETTLCLFQQSLTKD